jgi:hypothetical protein
MACGLLAANITRDCDSPIVAGVGDVLYVINFAEWQDATVTADPANAVSLTALTLASGDNIYTIEGIANSNRPRYEVVKEAGRVRFKHAIEFSVERDESATLEQIQSINQGRYVCILFTNTEQIQVFGAGTGLTIESGEQRNFYANQGAFTLILSSDDETLESIIPKNYVGTSSPYSFTTAKADITAQVAA